MWESKNAEFIQKLLNVLQPYILTDKFIISEIILQSLQFCTIETLQRTKFHSRSKIIIEIVAFHIKEETESSISLFLLLFFHSAQGYYGDSLCQAKSTNLRFF